MTEEFGTYKCVGCGETYNKTRSDEEALEEAAAQWGEIPEEEQAVVCDDCYQALLRNIQSQRYGYAH